MRQSEGICGIKRWTSRDRMSTFTSLTGEGYSTELAALAVSMVFCCYQAPLGWPLNRLQQESSLITLQTQHPILRSPLNSNFTLKSSIQLSGT